ncbi:hypothetical protein A2W24_04420 [Microgenomates group bacterium RBG_16_45_19]|nr:MAG: hypothetical protein A2W24_04420 [Microgenomates group bacterium RBG_16_45_19]
MPQTNFDVTNQLAQLENYIKDLDGLRNKSDSDFTPNSDVEVLAERRVYKAIQAALDLAITVNNQLGLGVPPTYRDVFINLQNKGVIDQQSSERMQLMAGMRNIIAHEYARIDPKKILQVIRYDYQDLVKFAGQVNDFLNEVK